MLREASLKTLRGCLEALPTEYRETLVMREMEEMPYQAIADAIALPIGTVMSRLSRARRLLADSMRVITTAARLPVHK